MKKQIRLHTSSQEKREFHGTCSQTLTKVLTELAVTRKKEVAKIYSQSLENMTTPGGVWRYDYSTHVASKVAI